jgi:hypothetical protein
VLVLHPLYLPQQHCSAALCCLLACFDGARWVNTVALRCVGFTLRPRL